MFQTNTEAIEVLIDKVLVNNTEESLVQPLRVTLAKTQPMIMYALNYVQVCWVQRYQSFMYVCHLSDDKLKGVV